MSLGDRGRHPHPRQLAITHRAEHLIRAPRCRHDRALVGMTRLDACLSDWVSASPSRTIPSSASPCPRCPPTTHVLSHVHMPAVNVCRDKSMQKSADAHSISLCNTAGTPRARAEHPTPLPMLRRARDAAFGSGALPTNWASRCMPPDPPRRAPPRVCRPGRWECLCVQRPVWSILTRTGQWSVHWPTASGSTVRKLISAASGK